MATIRPARATDTDLLWAMLALAADWRPGPTHRPVVQVMNDPSLARYVAGWPRTGDFGVVAEDGRATPVGAAWCRCFTADEPGYGFVAEEVPEVSIGVTAGARRGGIGRRLLAGVIDEARQRGIAQLSLSVEVDNFARGLYTDLGFHAVDEADGAVTMVLALAEGDTPP